MKEVSVPEATGMLGEVSGRRDLGPDVVLKTLRLDSLQLIEWLSMLEDKLEIEFDIRALDFYSFAEKSIGDVVRVLHEYAATAE
jgi:acyl carrier protein